MKIKTNVRFASSIGFSKNLWTYQRFFLVAFKFYTFSSWFNYNHWVEICYFTPLVRVSFIDVGSGFSIKNMNFSFLGQVFQYCLFGLKACQLVVASFGIRAQVLKSDLLSFLSFVSCYHLILFHLCSLFLVLILCRAPS